MEMGTEAKLTLSNVPPVISADFLVRGLSLKVTAVETATESEQNGLAEMGPQLGRPSLRSCGPSQLHGVGSVEGRLHWLGQSTDGATGLGDLDCDPVD